MPHKINIRTGDYFSEDPKEEPLWAKRWSLEKAKLRWAAYIKRNALTLIEDHSCTHGFIMPLMISKYTG